MRFSVLASILVFVLFGGLVGCSGGQQITHNSAEEAYEQGMTNYEEGDYEQAIRYFRAVFQQYGRGNEWAPEAQFQLAMAHRKQGKHLMAANEFQRFTQLYRNHERIPRVEFERANSYYQRSPSYQLDQSDTRQALSLFQLFMERYPNHELVPEAQEKVDELRAKLARKKYDAAQLYEERDMWRAATESYELVFDQYPDTPWADEALLGAVRSYVAYADRSVEQKQAERYQQALEHYQRLTQLFPDSDLIDQAESLYAEAQRKLKRVEAQQESLAQEGASGGSN